MRHQTLFIAATAVAEASAKTSLLHLATRVITEVTLNNAVLTGMTVQPASSPTSCYQFPLPTSSLHAIAFDASVASDGKDAHPVFLYVGDNATRPKYVGTLIDGKRCFLDISSNASAAGRMTLTIAGGDSLVFDETGVHLFDASCETISSITIRSFLDQLVSVSEAQSVSGIARKQNANAARKRAAPGSNFTVAIQVDDIVGGQLVNPFLEFGPSPCTFVTRQHGGLWDNLTWNCEYPGANSKLRACESAFQSWLRPSGPDGGKNGPLITSSNKLFDLLPDFLSNAAGSLAGLLPGLSKPLLQGMQWTKTAHAAILDVAQAGGESLCANLHVADQYEILFSDPGLTALHTIGVYRSPPVPTIIGTVASRTTRKTREPLRQINPTATEFSSVTATSFLVALGPSTGRHAGLGSVLGADGIDGGRTEPAGPLAVRRPSNSPTATGKTTAFSTKSTTVAPAVPGIIVVAGVRGFHA